MHVRILKFHNFGVLAVCVGCKKETSGDLAIRTSVKREIYHS